VDDFGRQVGCLLNGLLWTAGLSLLGLVILACLILAGVL